MSTFTKKNVKIIPVYYKLLYVSQYLSVIKVAASTNTLKEIHCVKGYS